MLRTKLLLLLLVFGIPSFAKIRKAIEMQKIAQRVIDDQNANEDVVILDETDNYAILGSVKGFVVVSKDDSNPAVLGYSHTPYDKHNIPCGLQWWLANINSTLECGEVYTFRAQRATEEVFQPEVIEPLLTTKWGQGDPFNYLCPKIGTINAPTGCVATAMAQILYFYRYPEKAEGKGYYTMGGGTYRPIVTVNSTYDWNLIKDSYASSWFLSEDEKMAIGQLMFDAGVSSHMDYDTGGSGTPIQIAGNGFAHIFKFDSLAMKCVNRDYCENDVVWMNTILKELKANRPVLMGGHDKNSGGHAFIIDGMDESGFVHVNWGWNGEADGYYDLMDMNPSNILGVSSTMHFNSSQAIITNLRCNPIPLEGEVYQSCWGISVEDNLIKDDLNGLTLSAPNGILWQHSHLTFYGQVGLAFFDENNQEVFFHTFFDTVGPVNHIAPIEGGHGYAASYFSRISTMDLATLPPGTYRVFLASKATQDLCSQFICYPGGKHNEYRLTKAANGSLTVEKSEPTAIKPLSVSNANVPARYFDLQGREMNAGTKGLVIRKQGNDVKKVVVR